MHPDLHHQSQPPLLFSPSPAGPILQQAVPIVKLT